MNGTPRIERVLQMTLAVVAVIFGLATMVAGGRVLAGADPGYIVFLPLLIFNTVMGALYIVAGFLMWRNPARGVFAAAAIFLLNLSVFGIIGYLHTTGHAIAIDSFHAMSFRTGVWLILFVGLAGLNRRRRPR